MSPTDRKSFVENLMGSPVGVALLGRLEVAQRGDLPWFASPQNCDPIAVLRSCDAHWDLSYGSFLEIAVDAAERLAGPWSGEALASLPALYEHARQRLAIAEAIAGRFGEQLHRDADVSAQQWWYESPSTGYVPPPCFTNYSNVYANGEFTFDGLWTVTDPPPEVHDALLLSWDFYGRPTSRWLLRVRPGARVWNVDSPQDWSRLVETYPKVATRPHYGWELPGPNQHRSDSKGLRAIPTQRAVRTEHGSHVLPDWARVATDFDGVHVSWAGFITGEGYISDLSDGGVTMMRYWGSEQTLWLHDVFETPLPLEAPLITGRIDATGVDVIANAERRSSDWTALQRLLDR